MEHHRFPSILTIFVTKVTTKCIIKRYLQNLIYNCKCFIYKRYNSIYYFRNIIFIIIIHFKYNKSTYLSTINFFYKEETKIHTI